MPKQRATRSVLWGAECAAPRGRGLAFGGQDRRSHEGRPHTRVLIDGQWRAIRADLREANPPRSTRDAWPSRPGRRSNSMTWKRR